MKQPNIIVSSDFGPLIININDKYIGKSICTYGYWATEDIKFIDQVLKLIIRRKKFATFYDVGANIGTHSLALAKLNPGKIKIRSFEAQRIIFNMLCGNMAINALTNVYCYNSAVSSSANEVLEIHLPDYSKENNFGGLELIPTQNSDNADMSTNGHEKVGTIKLDDFLEAVDFIKMDIEGMEDKALQGAKETIRNNRPYCFIEVSKTDVAFVDRYFKELGYFAWQRGVDYFLSPNPMSGLPSSFEKVF